MNPTLPPLARNVRQRMDDLGLTDMKRLSLDSGLGATYVRDLLEGRVRTPRFDSLKKLATTLQTTPEWLVADQDSADAALGPVARDRAGTGRTDRTATGSAPMLRPNVDASRVETENLVGAKDLPIFASAQGGSAGMLVNFEPIDWVKRPAPLERVSGGFGIYVVGDSMEPAIRQGDMLLIHPHKPPGFGDDVLIVFKNGTGETEAMVKRLVSQSSQGVRVRQFNPDVEFSIPRRMIEPPKKVVGLYRG